MVQNIRLRISSLKFIEIQNLSEAKNIRKTPVDCVLSRVVKYLKENLILQFFMMKSKGFV